jgi:hypothetical protein
MSVFAVQKKNKNTQDKNLFTYLMAQSSLHVAQNSSSYKRRKGIRDEVAAEKDGVAQCELASGVPL